MTERGQFLMETLDLPRATGAEEAKWEHFQVCHLADDTPFRIERKSRQVAWSWTAAAEAVAEALLHQNESLFVSINQDEAKEKIRYARRIYQSVGGVRKPEIVRDNEMGLELDVRGEPVRILSQPAKAPRGKPGFNVYLDEFAHAPKAQKIYTGALPVTTKGGRVRIGSSPMGASGRFWEVFTESMEAYPGYTRKTTPWWEVQALARQPALARLVAPQMSTAERVKRFGREVIQRLQENMPLEAFQQEYECAFLDENTAWITWDEIRAAQRPGLTCVIAEGSGVDISDVLLAIEDVARQVRRQEITERSFGLGVDVGRVSDTTELFLIGQAEAEARPLRMALTLDNVPFDEQYDVLHTAIKQLPVTKALIDEGGLGRQLAENAERAFPAKAEAVDFTPERKALWSTDAKVQMQKGLCLLPVDRDIAYQIHSIKRSTTPSRRMKFDVDTSSGGHADKYWAWALGLAAASREGTQRRGRRRQTSYLSQ